MNEFYLKYEMNKVLESIAVYKPDAVIADTRFFFYPMNQPSQFWIIGKFMPQVIKEGVRKYAILIGDDKSAYINDEASLGMEDFDLCYFNRTDKALNWIAPDAG